MKATITEHHAWLHQLVGQWRVEMPGPDGTSTEGTETVRTLGEAWVLLEGRGEMPAGAPSAMMMTLGYDPAQGAYVGTWIGSMMNHLWVYRGQLDADRKLLALHAQGPAFDDPSRLVNYRDEIEIVGPDERLLHGNMQGEDGQWTRFMTARYTRIG
jgi:hypothetical protein